MDLLIDTHALAWVVTADRRLSRVAQEALFDPANALFVSAVTAYEFVDLNLRGRLGADLSFDLILAQLGATVLDYPAAAYRIAQLLPMLHRDPVDRMMVAHAIHADLTLITADHIAQTYPVRSIW